LKSFDLEVTINIPTNGASNEGAFVGNGFFSYIDIKHAAAGDPGYTLQILNKRGTAIWESVSLTGDCVLHLPERIAVEDHKVKISASTLAGDFTLVASCAK